jgi:hypothetical protein
MVAVRTVIENARCARRTLQNLVELRFNQNDIHSEWRLSLHEVKLERVEGVRRVKNQFSKDFSVAVDPVPDSCGVAGMATNTV